MAVDYREQYRPDQLEPFWPNEIIKMAVVVLCTLAVIMLLAVLPVLLDMFGAGGLVHEEEPANPYGATPVGIKPEWCFLAVYQYLRLMPTTFLYMSGKTLGVLSQGPLALIVVLLPLWYRRRAHRRPRWGYRLVVTGAIMAFLALSIWGGWPEQHLDGHEQLAPFSEYLGHNPFLFIMISAALAVFYLMIFLERRAIRRVLDAPPPQDPNREDHS